MADKHEPADKPDKASKLTPPDVAKSVLTPTLRRVASYVAKKFDHLPDDHILRGDLSEMSIDLLAEAIRLASSQYPAFGKTGLLALAEGVESFRQEFCGESEKHGKPAQTQLPVQFTKIHGEFMTASLKEIAGLAVTDPAKAKEAKTRLMEDAAWVHEISKVLANGPKKEEPPKTPGVPLTKQIKDGLDRFATTVKLSDANSKLRERLERRRADIASRT